MAASSPKSAAACARTGETVIICICRRISDRSMRDAIAGGAKTAGAVFRAAGCAPQCGSCVPMVKTMIEQTVEIRSSEDGALSPV